ncbi:UNVERIFIED_CONTAM: hypothetical protein GTU68_000278 [Idotea baltica]|nr:hypothetical protein [Idotea baltica]
MSTLRLPPLPSIGDLLKIYKLKATKNLSQNFLLDCKLQSKLVKMAGNLKGCHVIEVGPGPGGLTRSIFEQGANFVHVIEKDARFIPTLELLKDATQNRLSIHLGDILKYDLSSLLPTELSQPWDGPIPKSHIIGNLPFNVSTPLIIKWLHEISLKSNAWVHGRVPLTLTFQEEVGQRMSAPPYNIQRSRLSIMCQNWCEVKHKFIIPGKAFIPKPDVNVCVMHFIPRVTPIINLDFKIVEKVVYAVFSQRRKHCKRGIGSLFPLHLREKLVPKLLIIADIDETKKPYELSIADFNRLSHSYVALMEENPSIKKY